MKKIYTLATVLVATIAFAQNNFSFETSEGYNLGNINGQNGWEVTLNNNNQPINNQSISNEKASAGANALKIDIDANENLGWFPMFGASKELSTAVNYKNLSIEFDALVTKLDGSSYDFGAWGIIDEEYMPISYFAFNAIGKLEIVSSADYIYQDTGFTWKPNTWYNLRAEVSENQIKYFVNNALIYTGTNFSKTDLLGVTFVHDNFEGAAYIDNIKINNVDLATYEAQNPKALKSYPNPAKDLVSFSSDEKITEFSIYNMAGQKVKTGNNSENIDIKSLAKGNYVLQAKTVSGKTISSKLIKN